MPDENYARVTFEDLGPVSSIKPCVYESITNVIHIDPAGTGINITLRSGGTATKVTSSAPVFTSAMVLKHLHVPGAANEANRALSQRITNFVSTTEIAVEYGYGATETVNASAGGTAEEDNAWAILESQKSKAPVNDTKLTVCKPTGVFRDDVLPGFQVTAP